MKLSIILIISSLLILLARVKADPNDGLVAKYLLQGSLEDTTGNHEDIQNQGLTLTSDKNGNSQNAYLFDEFRDILIVPNSVVNGLVDYTVSFWIKADSLSGNSVYYSWANTSVNRYLYKYFFSKYLGIGGSANNNNYNQWSLQENISNGNWQFVTLSRDASENKVSIYVDGVLHEEFDTNRYDTTDPIQVDGFIFGNLQDSQIYGGYSQSWQYFGSISDIRVFDRYFTASDAVEVMEDYGNGGNTNTNNQQEPTNAQTCIDYLKVLEHSIITEELTFPLNTTDNEYYHHYNISFNEFYFDETCFQSQVWLGSNLISHEVEDNGIIITFPWKDAAQWGCNQVSPNEQQCQFQVHVYLNNTLQHKKLFSSTVTTQDLNNVTQELSLSVFNDEDESFEQFDQSIDTSINFCTDLQCTSYANVSQIIRNTDIFVEFKIDSQGYNQYYPVHQRFTLDGFQVGFQNQQAIESWGEQGRIIYHFRPPFAGEDVLIAIGISLQKTNPNRRMLQQSNNNVDTSIGFEEQKDNVGKYMRISVLDESEVQEVKDQETQTDNTVVYLGLVVGAVIVIVSMVGIFVYYKLKIQKSQGTQQENSGQKIEHLESEQKEFEVEIK